MKLPGQGGQGGSSGPKVGKDPRVWDKTSHTAKPSVQEAKALSGGT